MVIGLSSGRESRREREREREGETERKRKRETNANSVHRKREISGERSLRGKSPVQWQAAQHKLTSQTKLNPRANQVQE